MDFDYLDEIKIQRPSKFAPKTLQKDSKQVLKQKESFCKDEPILNKTISKAESTQVLEDVKSLSEKTDLQKEQTVSKKEILHKIKLQTTNSIEQQTLPKEEEENYSEQKVLLQTKIDDKAKTDDKEILEDESFFIQKEPSKNEIKLQPQTESKVPQKYKEQKSRTRTLHNKVIMRYLCRELFLYFAVSFGFFFVAFFVNQILLLAETILRQRVPVGSTIKLITYCLPGIVAQSAPFATLVGFLMCLGRMATDNEILVLRASGYRYFFILSPVILMGVMISIFSFIMNDYFLPLGVLNYNRLQRQIVSTDPAVEIEANSVRRMNNTMLVIGDVTENNISDLVFFDTSKDGKQRIILTRNSEVRQSDSSDVLMQFDMNGVTAVMLDKANKKNFDVLEAQKAQLNVFDSVLEDYDRELAPREMTSFDLWQKIKDMKKNPDVSVKRINSYSVEFNKKFSMPFGSIFFAMLAFPLSLIFGKRDGQTLGFIFGIIISVLYWAATILGQLFGIRSGWNGFWMMWSPNIFLGLVGIFLYTKLRKK